MSHSSVYAADTFVASAGSSLHLLRQQPAVADGVTAGGSSQPLNLKDVVVQHPCAINTVRWNRNNKVVAAGCADGTIQLLYSSGVVMCVLPRDGTPPASLGSISSLSWSAGSKRLAAGSSNGNAYVFDMQNKHPMVALGGHLGGVTALEYQHEDKLLAVASGSGSVVAYSDPHRADGGGAASAVPLMASADSSARLCLSVSSGGSEAALAAGSAAGGVTVWDVPTRRVREEWVGQHGGAAVRAVAFAPLRPGWLYSAGDDGRVVLQDRQAGLGHASIISVGAPATSLMIKEDLSVLGVGTADGVVLLYDPRHLRQPLQSLHCGEAGQPITGLHWQHRYSSLNSSRHRAAAAAAAAAAGVPGGGNAPSRLGMAPASSTAAAAAGATPGISAAPVAQSGSVAASAASARTAGAATTPTAALKSKLAAMLQPRSAACSQLAGASDKRMSVSAPGSRATSPPLADAAAAAAGAAAGAAAATPVQPRSLRVQPPSAQPAAAAGAGGSGLAQITPLSLPPTAAEMPAITPLPGMAPRYAAPSAAAAAVAAAMGEVTPVQQQFQQHRLGTAGAGFGSEQHVLQQTSPLEQLAAAPMSLNITRLAGAPAARTLAAPAATAGAVGAAAAAAGYAVSPLSQRGSSNGSGGIPAGAGALGAMEQFSITPLPGMPAAQPAASPKQRSVLGERTNNTSVGGHGMLPRLASPLPAAPEAAPPQHSHMQASPSFAENLSSPTAAASPRPSAASKQQQQAAINHHHQQQQAGDAAADAAAHKAKLVAAAQLSGNSGGGQLSPAASGSGASWYIGATPADELLPTQAVQQQQNEMAAAAVDYLAPAAAGSPLEFCFAAAQRSLQQLASSGGTGGGPAAAGLAGAGAETAAAGGAAGAPGLRDDILAMHLDMLTQFQAQQQSMGQMVSAVLERNAELSQEVAALRKQMAGLAGRRADFLWL